MIYLTALLFIKEGKENVFNEYESLVLPIINNYNGKLIYRIRPTQDSFINSEDQLPYEIHFISFETDEDFTNFINDDKRKSFEKLKVDSIKSTFITKGEKL
ncbi:DUF1330 domain-containing protein [Flavivirga rizhaonensis]|uniref:DUF1330 domain-containing protein n=1 Tax=Flavivirga rizhaonensis TaxID=2559571 RepID=A0A4S1DZT7_9FLAO|nr:DUF1330 domain-containing protein [Flavivirga rizhaonensis]TGV03750.1 DUF1330 domain-containing protein [Flavivirga rizhaonensis]